MEFSQETVKVISSEELPGLCSELRKTIITTVSKCGGHLSSNLGSVEVTVALHRVFDFSNDKLVFDVGHQCYTHKLLTGRAGKFSTLRQAGGLSGFPKRNESEFDCYETGHAGTAISAAIGIEKALRLQGLCDNVVAFVGDGSFNNGLIYEAFNSLSVFNSKILIILNDNGMSISPTVGGMHEILSELSTPLPPMENVALFERFGLSYMGVYDGNDVNLLEEVLKQAKEKLKVSSVLLHIHTRKGFGYAFSESAPTKTHGVSPEGKDPFNEYSTVLGEELTKLAEGNKNIVAVTAAMTDSLGLRPFFDRFPERAFDVGICEENASVLCASMASAGLKPYYAIYSTFLQRAFDEIIHDVCGQDLSVTFCIDRAGVTGADGETHQGVFDLSYLSLIPNLTIGCPKNIAEFRQMLKLSEKFDHPFAIRYPRAGEEGTSSNFKIGEWEFLTQNYGKIAILATGERAVDEACDLKENLAVRGISATVVNARFVKPLDESVLKSLQQKTIITIEDNVKIGGFGDMVARYFGNTKSVVSFAFDDKFIPHGEASVLRKQYGWDRKKMINTAVKANEG